MNYNFIKTSVENHVFRLTLARPEKRNAFTPTMINEIADALQTANENSAVKVVVLQAEGPVFCAGMDTKVFENPDLDTPHPEISNQNISLGEVFERLHKPSIALVEGNVIAGGFLFILGCTYVYCKREVQFRLPELAIGLFPFQVMASLLKVMPEKKVLQLCLETEYFSAEKAKNLGIVDEYLDEVDHDSILDLYSTVDVKVMKAGINALRTLPTIDRKEQYKFLKDILDGLKKS